MKPLLAIASLWVTVVSAVALGGCPVDSPDPGTDAPACTLPFIGDATKSMTLEIIARDAAGRSSKVTEGGDVAIVYPPQGGRVIFVAARVTNVDPCAVKLSGVLRDLTTGQVRLDIRTVNLVPTGDGFGSALDADLSSFSNVPVCPNQWATDDVDDKPYELQVTVTDKSGRTATQKTKVVPRCAEPEREVECRCICRKGYVLGQACTPSDAGPDAGSADANEDGG